MMVLCLSVSHIPLEDAEVAGKQGADWPGPVNVAWGKGGASVTLGNQTTSEGALFSLEAGREDASCVPLPRDQVLCQSHGLKLGSRDVCI